MRHKGTDENAKNSFAVVQCVYYYGLKSQNNLSAVLRIPNWTAGPKNSQVQLIFGFLSGTFARAFSFLWHKIRGEQKRAEDLWKSILYQRGIM